MLLNVLEYIEHPKKKEFFLVQSIRNAKVRKPHCRITIGFTVKSLLSFSHQKISSHI